MYIYRTVMLFNVFSTMIPVWQFRFADSYTLWNYFIKLTPQNMMNFSLFRCNKGMTGIFLCTILLLRVSEFTFLKYPSYSLILSLCCCFSGIISDIYWLIQMSVFSETRAQLSFILSKLFTVCYKIN